MNTSAYKNPVAQPFLFDEPVTSLGRARTVVGELGERLTAALVGGRRHRTDCTADYCPDVSVGDRFYESKVVGLSRVAFVYGGRLVKDRQFASRHSLTYVVWHHTTQVSKFATVNELERAVLDSMRALYIVPFAVVDALCRGMAPDKLNSRYGRSQERPEYGSGYRIPLKLLERWRTCQLILSPVEGFARSCGIELLTR